MRARLATILIICSCYFIHSCVIETFPKGTQVVLSRKYSSLKYYPSVNLDTLNKFDTNNHKVGWWIELLTKDGIRTRNFTEAVFYRYCLKNGTTLYPYDLEMDENISDTVKAKHWYDLKEVDNTNSPQKDTIVIMNGKYQWYFKNKLTYEEEYKNGMILSSKVFGNSGKILNWLDYKTKYNNLPLSGLSIQYFEKTGEFANANYLYIQSGHIRTIKSNYIVK